MNRFYKVVDQCLGLLVFYLEPLFFSKCNIYVEQESSFLSLETV